MRHNEVPATDWAMAWADNVVSFLEIKDWPSS